MTCDRDRIYALVESSASADVETEAHLSSCPECMELYGSVVEFATALDDAAVWDGEVVFLPSLAEPGPGADLLVAESLRLYEERARGLDLVATLLGIAPDGWHGHLRRIDGVCTVGLVEALLEEARKRSSTPREFERIADLAIEVSEALDPRSYPPGMVARSRGNAWKDRANALRLRGEFQDALWALDEAERHFRKQPIPEFDLATADYVRATILVETDRVSECLELAERCAQTFLDYGDLHRQIHAKMVEAGALYNLGRKRESREVSLSLLKPLQEIGESRTLGARFLEHRADVSRPRRCGHGLHLFSAGSSCVPRIRDGRRRGESALGSRPTDGGNAAGSRKHSSGCSRRESRSISSDSPAMPR